MTMKTNMSMQLRKIMSYKEKEIAARKLKCPLIVLREQVKNLPVIRPFRATLEKNILQKKPAVIAEIKKASPSKGIIRDPFDVEEIAKDYARFGATCLSVLTDEHFFQGSDEYLKLARSVVDLPVLRKDFIIDEYQIWESRLLGADAILLIVSALASTQLTSFYRVAKKLGLDVLIEVHDASELELAIQFKDAMLGVNNRNLNTFETNLSVTHQLVKKLPDQRWLVTESGIQSKSDVQGMLDVDVYGFLVGEAFMRADSPGEALDRLFFYQEKN